MREPDVQEFADYAAAQLLALKEMARVRNLKMLAWLLEMATLQAKEDSRNPPFDRWD